MNEIAERCDLQTVSVAKSTNNKEEAPETVQEAFLKAYEQLEQFRKDSRCLCGLIETALNHTVIDYQYLASIPIFGSIVSSK